MTPDELLDRLREGTSRHWHWWSWHFQAYGGGRAVPFTQALLLALLTVDAVMPGYAVRMADSIVAIGGRDRDDRDYEQLLQLLAEIHVATHVVSASWPKGTTFADEPVAPGSARNPELVISTPELRIGVEVKAPSLLEHEAMRGSRPLQAGGRIFSPAQLAEVAGGKDKLTLPRDNPVKDFLVSADGKFASFRAKDDEFYGLLVIVWDDFIYEPVTALTHPASGLLTARSFARSGDGPLRYRNIDAIVLLSHLQWLKRALAEDNANFPFAMSAEAFRWDFDPARPAAVIVPPDGRGLPAEIDQLLSLRPLETIPGAEYQPSDLVNWIDPNSQRGPAGDGA